MEAALKSLLQTYTDLNANVLDELHDEPSALEFMRYVAANRPFVVRRGAAEWTAVRRWDASYLEGVLGGNGVQVAMTPFGNADSVLEKADGSLCFVKPYEEIRPFREVLRSIQDQERHRDPDTPVYYAQTQNDNLRNEYATLFAQDVPPDVPWARIALQKQPDAINFWLGNSLSVTALHKDNYENIYVQVRGQKHFVLLPPVAAPCVNEVELPGETYVWEEIKGSVNPDARKQLVSMPDRNEDQEDGREGILNGAGERRGSESPGLSSPPPPLVPVATWDPDYPEIRATRFSNLVEPIRVTLDEGDMLYLPAMWFHKVSQSCGREGFCCAINYWYDMDFAGGFWATNSFVREVGNLAVGGEKSAESN